MSIGLNSHCFMRSKFTETDSSGDTNKIRALSREIGSPRLTDSTYIFKNVYGRYRSKPISIKQHQQQT